MSVEQAQAGQAGGPRAALDSPAAAAMLPSSSLTLPTSGGGLDFLKRKLRNGDLERERDFFFSEADEPAAEATLKAERGAQRTPSSVHRRPAVVRGMERRDWTDCTGHRCKAQRATIAHKTRDKKKKSPIKREQMTDKYPMKCIKGFSLDFSLWEQPA